MRYILLNPAERFREVVEQARSVVLAGGTMEPVSVRELVSGSTRSLALGQRLFPPAVPCHPTGPHHHAIMRARHPQVQSPHASRLARSTKAAFRIQVFEPGRRDSGELYLRVGETVLTPALQLTELGAVVQSVIGLVPQGVVVFLPSYAFLDKVKAFWTRSGLLQKLADKKQASVRGVDRDEC